MTENTIEHDPNEKRPKYPRKVLFGLLTDYGPPKGGIGWSGWISIGIFCTAMNIANNGWPF